jgi:hypothetical protein
VGLGAVLALALFVVPLTSAGRSLLKRNRGALKVAIRLGASQVRTVSLIAPSGIRRLR